MELKMRQTIELAAYVSPSSALFMAYKQLEVQAT
jgi:hypothetical protein